MRSKTAIELDYKKAIQKAESIERIVDRLNGMSASDLENILQNLSSGWKGDNAVLYLSKGAVLQGKIKETARELFATASAIRTIAKRIYDADMEAYRIAKRREKK